MARPSKNNPNALTKAEISAIFKKLLKVGAYVSEPEAIMFNQIRKDFPDREFWVKYDFPFRLNSIGWFKTPDGKERLQSMYDTFHFRFDNIPKANDSLEVQENFVLEKLPESEMATDRSQLSISEILKSKENLYGKITKKVKKAAKR